MPGGDAGAVGHRVGDKAGQDRHEHREGEPADLEQHRRDGEPLVDVCLRHRDRAADGERQRDQDTARHHERDHVADPGHEPAPDLGPATPAARPDGHRFLVLVGRRPRGRGRRARAGLGGGLGPLYDLGGLIYGLAQPDLDGRASVEALAFGDRGI
jgi:hypothetical protein